MQSADTELGQVQGPSGLVSVIGLIQVTRLRSFKKIGDRAKFRTFALIFLF